MKTILVPIDFEEYSEYALETAAGIARKANALLIVLHVIDEPSNESYTIDGEYIPDNSEDKLFTLLLLKKRRQQFLELEKAESLQGVRVKFELRVGDAFHGITSIILNHKVDLVVMGAKGSSSNLIIPVGSVTTKVLRHSKCPVLTVHNRPAVKDFRTIVFATNCSENEEVFSRMVRNAQDLYNGTVHLVRAITPYNFTREHEAKRLLADYAAKHQFKNYTINAYTDITEEDAIVRFAESVGADMIAIATHARSGFMHLIGHSVSKEVLNHSPLPVMTFLID